MASKLFHTSKRQSSTEGMALASTCKELHQVAKLLANRHPPNLPTIYPSSDLPNIFIRHINDKVEKRRADNATDHVFQILANRTTTATLSSFEKVSQSTLKECILISARNSCDLDPIH